MWTPLIGLLERCASNEPHPAIAEVQRIHELTPAEVKLVAFAVESTAHKYLANALGLSTHTVKTQTRSILLKARLASLEDLIVPLRKRLLG
jgi:FixJ family two-component response regulator